MDFMKEYEKWLASPALSQAEKEELEAIKNDPKEIEARFYGPLEFGTAGLRGTMYTGLHNMNIHVIRWATQGFADVICAEGEEGKQRGVAICMDCRNHSMEFARAAAEVCAANGIHVRIFESLRPTPELSFAVREYGGRLSSYRLKNQPLSLPARMTAGGVLVPHSSTPMTVKTVPCSTMTGPSY